MIDTGDIFSPPIPLGFARNLNFVGRISVGAQVKHAPVKDQLGLVVAARTFCREVSLQSGIPVHFEQHDVPRATNADIALCLYRVIQEAVQNSVRHNGGAAIQVSLTHDAEQIRLLITDEGKGFDVEHAMRNGGLGLVSMRERVRQVKGSSLCLSGLVPFECRSE